MNFEDMAFLFQCDNRNRGIIRMNFDEVALLWKCVKRSYGNILEIGRRYGGSTFLIQSIARYEREIVSVDLENNIHPFLEKQFTSNVHFLTQNSRIPILGYEWGLVFIDGDHSKEGVGADLKTHWPRIARGGLIAMHDARPNEGLDYAPGHSDPGNFSPGVFYWVDWLIEKGIAAQVDYAGSLVVLKKIKEI